MPERAKKRILIVEDAKGTAAGYKTLLEGAGYDAMICASDRVPSLIDERQEFDLAIMDIVLPVEDQRKYGLADCQETGIRLTRLMAESNVCHRFYVITVRGSLRDRVMRICEEKKVLLRFEHKLDHEPQKLADIVADLIATPIP